MLSLSLRRLIILCLLICCCGYRKKGFLLCKLFSLALKNIVALLHCLIKFLSREFLLNLRCLSLYCRCYCRRNVCLCISVFNYRSGDMDVACRLFCRLIVLCLLLLSRSYCKECRLCSLLFSLCILTVKLL